MAPRGQGRHLGGRGHAGRTWREVGVAAGAPAAIRPGGSWPHSAGGREIGVNGCPPVPIRTLAHEPQQVRCFRPGLVLAFPRSRTPQLLVISDEVYKYTVYDGVHEHFAAVRHLPCPCPHGVHFPRTEPPPERRDSAAGDVRPHGDALIGREDVLGDRVAGGVVRRAVAARAPHSAAAPLCAVLRGDARAAGVLPACARPPVVPGSHPRLCQALSRVLAAADEPYEGHACYYDHLCELYRHKREILATGLRRCGMQPLRGNGGFFLMAETSRLTVPEEYLRQTTAAAPEMTRDWCALPRHRPARFGPFRRRRRHPSPSPRQGVVPMARVRGGRDRDSMRTVLLVCAQASCREPRALRLLQERRNAH